MKTEIPEACDPDGFPIQAMTGERLDEIRALYPLRDGSQPWDADDAVDAFEAVVDLVIEVDRMLVVEAAFREVLKPSVDRDQCHRSIWTCEQGHAIVPQSTLAAVTVAKMQALAERDMALMEIERLRAELAEKAGRR